MFCLHCGEPIPDGSTVCPKCGAILDEPNKDQVVVIASQKEIDNSPSSYGKDTVDNNNLKNLKNPFIALTILSVLSLVFLKLRYMIVSVDLYYGGVDNTEFTGYYLIQCLNGKVGLSGYMAVILILLNIITIIISIICIRGIVNNKNLIRMITLSEAILYIPVTIIPYFHLKGLVDEFVSEISTGSIGPGCYLNIVIAIIISIICFTSVVPGLKE